MKFVAVLFLVACVVACSMADPDPQGGKPESKGKKPEDKGKPDNPGAKGKGKKEEKAHNKGAAQESNEDDGSKPEKPSKGGKPSDPGAQGKKNKESKGKSQDKPKSN